MKRFFKFALLILIAGCKKESAQKTDPTIDPTKTYKMDFDVTNQIVKTSVEHNTLHLDWYENVNFIVDPKEYGGLWAVFVKEDFSKTNLSGLHYTALNEYGSYATDWVSQNLNNVHPTQKSIVDTTINGTTYTKIKLTRALNFTSKFSSAQAAIDKQNALLQVKNDSISFSCFFYYKGVYSLGNGVTTGVNYTK